jgi:hypothetical protein
MHVKKKFFFQKLQKRHERRNYEYIKIKRTTAKNWRGLFRRYQRFKMVSTCRYGALPVESLFPLLLRTLGLLSNYLFLVLFRCGIQELNKCEMGVRLAASNFYLVSLASAGLCRASFYCHYRLFFATPWRERFNKAILGLTGG